MREDKGKDKSEKLTKGVAPIVQVSEIKAGCDYLKAVNLPEGALPSVIISYQTSLALRKLIREEQNLTAEQRAALVSTREDIVITPFIIGKIDKFVRDFQFPYSTLYLSQDRKTGAISINPKAAGWRMKLRADPRIFKSWEIVSVDYQDFPDERAVTVHLVAHFWNGETHAATGSCSTKEKGKQDWPISTLKMTAETRAQNRAIRACLGLPFEFAEDIIEFQEQEKEFEVAPVSEEGVTGKAGMTKLSFVTRARKEFNYSVKDILNKLGIANLADIEDFDEAFIRLQTIHAAEQEPEAEKA